MVDFNVGPSGWLRITDDGTYVRFYVVCSDPATHGDNYRWFGRVNGVNVSGVAVLEKNFKTKLLGAWAVSTTQDVYIGQQDTGTYALNGAYQSPNVRINRATVPAAPTPLGIDTIRDTSLRYRFSANGNGGSSITEYQVQVASNSGFTANVQNIKNVNGTQTVSGLTPHTQYWVRVRAKNAVGWSGYSGATTASTLGQPSAPRTPVATPSTTVTGRVALSWTVPLTTGAGGITGYNIFRDGVQISSTTGTGTTYTDNGLTPYQSYSYTIAARNGYSNSFGGTSPQSTSVVAAAPGPPSAPRNVTATPDGAIPGKVDLSWTAPINTGAGGITGYRVYFAGGALITQTSGTGTTYSVTGLNPGSTYSFQVFALNALAVAEGSMSEGSNTPTASPVGEPGAPTGVTLTQSVTTSNRLVLSWTPPLGTLSGYSIFSRTNGVDTLIQKINASHTSFAVDSLPAGSARSYVVRARTTYTDTLSNGYPGNWGGPASTAVTASASNDARQAVSSLSAAISATNATFNGTYTITGVTNNTISYSKIAGNIPAVSSGGTIANNTNAVFNGTVTLTGSPSPSSFTFAKTNANIPLLNVFSGTLSNTTNTSFNATNVQVTSVNSGAHTLTYSKTGANLATTIVPVNTPPGARGLVTNLTNASFNVSGKLITATTKYTLKYAQTGSNVTENNAAGTVTNVSNRDVFNGIYSVLSTADYRTLSYTTSANSEAGGVRVWDEPRGTVERSTSKASLDVLYRSGWIG